MTTGPIDYTRLDDKSFATLAARAARLAVELYRDPRADGTEGFRACKWAQEARLDSAAEVDTWLRRLGGPNA